MKSKRSAVLGLIALAALTGCSSGPTSLGLIAYDPTGIAVRHKTESDKTINCISPFCSIRWMMKLINDCNNS